MQRLILHIGTSKTGTSALQEFFAQNRLLLEEAGVGYYQPSRPFYPMGAGNGVFLFRGVADSITGKYRFQKQEDYAREFDAFVKYASARQTVLLSSEDFWQYGCENRAFWPLLRDKATGAFGADVAIDLVVYLRRQDLFLYSRWKQDIKGSTTLRMGFRGWLERGMSRQMEDYRRHLDKLSDVFGQKSVIVRRYAKDEDDEWDIFKDFCQAAGLSWTENYARPAGPQNPSVSLAATRAMIALRRGKANNKAARTAGLWQQMAAIELFSALYPEDKTLYPLGLAERNALVQKYEEDNQCIARTFLGEERLFPEVERAYPVCVRERDKIQSDARILARLLGLPLERLRALQKELS